MSDMLSRCWHRSQEYCVYLSELQVLQNAVHSKTDSETNADPQGPRLVRPEPWMK